MESIDFVLDHIFNHLPLILLIILSLWFISLAIIIINGSHLKTKNSDNTCDTDNGNNTDDTDNNEDEKYITDNNENEKHIMANTNEHRSASTETLLYCCLLLIVVLIFTKL